MDDNRFRITVKLGGVVYPITIVRNEEEKYRKAEVKVNRMVANYKNTFSALPENYFAMAALQSCVENVELTMSNDEKPVIEKLSELEGTLDQFLEKTK